MNPGASAILRRLGLPQTTVLTFEEVTSSALGSQIYVRYRTGSNFKNGRVDASVVGASADVFRSRMASGELVSFERCYDTIVGGISVVKKEFVYSEMVQGHSNALLRRGCCGARVLLARDGRRLWSIPPQKWQAKQANGYLYSAFGRMTAPVVESIADQLQQLHRVDIDNVLLEWMLTDEGLLFCDASHLVDTSFGENLPRLWARSEKVVDIRGVSLAPPERSGRLFWDELDCDETPPAVDGDTIACAHGALLAHFVTRAIARRVAITWVDPRADLLGR